MNQEERRQLVERIMLAVQRGRSNVVEVMDLVDLEADEAAAAVMAELFPQTLTPESPLLDACVKMLKRDKISGGELYNVVFLAQKDSLVEVYFALQEWELPEPDVAWAVEDLEEDVADVGG